MMATTKERLLEIADQAAHDAKHLNDERSADARAGIHACPSCVQAERTLDRVARLFRRAAKREVA